MHNRGMVKRLKKPENVALGKRIKIAREKAGLVQADFAREFGVSIITVSRWETGAQAPNDKTKRRIAEITKTTLAYLLSETDDPSSQLDNRALAGLNTPKKEMHAESLQGRMLGLESLTLIPVISPEVKVSAGAGNCCEEIIWEEIDRFPLFDGKIAALYSDNGLLSIYVEGDSMEPQIHDGDLVIFKKSHEWMSGNIVVVCLDGRLMVKGIVKGPEGETRLRSLNKVYEDIIIGKASFFLVYGRVLKIVRQWDPKPVL